MLYMEIYLARHGETQFNKEKRIMGQMMVPLNDTGREQAKKLAVALKDENITAIHSSDLTRATETSEFIAAELGLSFETYEELREHGVGNIEGKIWVIEYAKMTLEEFDQLMVEQEGELTEPFVDRVWKVFLEIIKKHKKGDKILIMSHGGCVRTILMKILKSTLDIFNILSIDNCSISKVIYNSESPNSKFRVEYVNDSNHLK